MKAQWIKHFYNNTDKNFYVWLSAAAQEKYKMNGTVQNRSGKVEQKIEGGVIFAFPARTIAAMSVEIPPYQKSPELYFLAVSASPPHNPMTYADRDEALLLWRSRDEGEGGITFVNGSTMHGIYNMNFEKDYENYYALFLDMVKQEDNTQALEVTLEMRDSGVMKHWLFNHEKQRLVESHQETDALRKEAGKAIVMALV